MRKINEIFQSIQGEGCNVGVPSVFIRFSGCNLKCDFCDTQHESGQLMSDEDLILEVKKYGAPMVVLTGGEPTLWIDEDFVGRLKHETGKLIAIETNGTNPVPSNIDWVTVSPKDSLNSLKADRADELKVVELGQDLECYFNLDCVGSETKMMLQPCYVEDPVLRENNMRRTIRRVLGDPRWRLSLQTHKLIGVR